MITRILGVLLLSSAALSACRNASGAPPTVEAQEQRVRVRVAPVLDSTVALPVTGSGVLGAKEEVPLAFKIGGVVSRVLVDPGARVEAGQLLAALELPEIDGAVARAEAARTQAERELVRAEALYRDSVIPRSAWEGAETAAAVARADLQVAQFNRRYAVIVAPSSGTILTRMVEPGQQVSGGVPVLVLARAGKGQVVRVGLADRDVRRVAVGDVARVRFAGAGGVGARGRVSQIASQAAPGTGTWSVEIRLDRPETIAGGLASGLIGTVEIEPAHATPVTLVPITALLEGDGDSAAVYTLSMQKSDTVATRRAVRVAFLAGDRAAIAAGLAGAREVVTDGAAYLGDGDRVALLREAPVREGGGQ